MVTLLQTAKTSLLYSLKNCQKCFRNAASMCIHLSLTLIIIMKNLQALTLRVVSPVAFISNEAIRDIVGYYVKENMIFY